MTNADQGTHEPEPPPVATPRGEPYTETREFGLWAVLGLFAAGAALGAGAAVLLAPESGSRTRRRLARGVRRLTRRERSSWKRLTRVLDKAAERRRGERSAGRLEEERHSAQS